MAGGRYGMSGWKEFHRNRKNILDEMDKVLEQTSNRPVKTAHGTAVEAFIRNWLSEFLPKKFSVTSGYIIPSLYNDNGKLYHFDIIIYDSLNSPVLWVEGNSDNSEQGKYRAIPAKHVLSVFEVKSTLSVKTVKDVFAKLMQIDEIREHLPKIFSSAAFFIELPKKEVRNKSILKALLEGAKLSHFWGGVVLRCTVDESATGIIEYLQPAPDLNLKDLSDTPILAPIDDIKVILMEDGSSIQMQEGVGTIRLMKTSENSWSVSKIHTAMYQDDNNQVALNWSRGGFAEFSMEILRTLEGSPVGSKDNYVFGLVFDELDVKRADFQPEEQTNDSPFLNLKIEPIDDSGEYLKVEVSDEGVMISYLLIAENHSKFPVCIGDNLLKNFIELPAGQKAKSLQNALAKKETKLSKKDLSEFNDIADGKKPLTFVERLVYRYVLPDGSKKLLCTAKRFSVYIDKVESETLHSYDDFI